MRQKEVSAISARCIPLWWAWCKSAPAPSPPAENNPPQANDDSASTNQGNPVTFDVLSNDSDSDGDTLAITVVTNPANGTATDNGNGTITYEPNAGFSGTNTFGYTISDGRNGTDTATVTVNVNAASPPPGPPSPPENVSPEAADDAASTDQDTSAVVNVLENDSDADGDALTVSAVSDPAGGSAVVNGNGTVTYTPDSAYTGPDTFEYTVSDGRGGTDNATVTMTVNAAGQLPPPPGPAPQPEKDMFCGRLASDYDNVVMGTNAGETMWGTEKDDLIRGWGGNDTIYGMAGSTASGEWSTISAPGAAAGDAGAITGALITPASFKLEGTWTSGGFGTDSSVVCNGIPLPSTVVIGGPCGNDVQVKFTAANGVTGKFKGDVTCSAP